MDEPRFQELLDAFQELADGFRELLWEVDQGVVPPVIALEAFDRLMREVEESKAEFVGEPNKLAILDELLKVARAARDRVAPDVS